MEELDKLKKDWQKSADLFPKFTEVDLYKMLHKKSSSVVKWILIISILEFALWVIASYLLSDTTANKQFESYNVDYIMTPLSIIWYGFIIYFLFRFYSNYRKITTTDNVRTLMSNILNTRKTVLTYMYISIVWSVITCIISLIIFIDKDASYKEALNHSEAAGNAAWFYVIYFGFSIIALSAVVGAVWGFYKLIYGLLLKRLHRNYNELKKIDL